MSSKRVVLITGANSGIGYEAAKALLQSKTSYQVLLGARSREKGEAAVEQLRKEFSASLSGVEFIQVDILSNESIHEAVNAVEVKYGVLDVLINNAGAAFDLVPGNSDDDELRVIRDAFDNSFRTNATGSHVVTHAFAPLLVKSIDPRLLFVTSGLATLTGTSENGLLPHMKTSAVPAGWPKPSLAKVQAAYRSSKSALNMVMLTWSCLLKEDGVKTWSITPGFLATGILGNEKMMKESGAGHPSLGGEFIRDVVEGVRDADVGRVIHRTGVQEW